VCSALFEIGFGIPTIDWSWSVRAFLAHFALGFWVAFLTILLTLTISRCFGVTRTEELRIRRYSLWLALSLSIVSHVLEDYLWGAF